MVASLSAQLYTGEYEVSWLAKLLHSFPHLDLTFQFTNSSFNPEHPRYREALLFWGAIPVLWLLVTLLIFLMYFCYRCCQKDASKKRHGSCLPWAMAILALLTGAVIGVGFYGNEEVHKGVMEVTTAGQDAEITIHHMQTEVHDLGVLVNQTLTPDLNQLRQWSQRIATEDQQNYNKFLDQALSHASKIITSVVGIEGEAKKIHMSDYLGYVREYGYYRWVGTIALLCWEVLLVLLLLFGIGRSSKCTLLMFCAFGIFTLVLCWVSAGIHLATSVGLGDFCMSPDFYIEKYTTSPMEKKYLKYYMKCNDDVSNPFQNSLKSSMDSITATKKALFKAFPIAESNNLEIADKKRETNSTLTEAIATVQQLTGLVSCRSIHRDYEHAVHGVCYLALPGLVFVLLSAAVAGLMLTTLVLLASCAWRHFGPRKGYREVDEDETFLPRNDNASPSYYSFPRGRHSNPREHVPMQGRRSSPPPAYASNEFYRQYGDMSHGAHAPPPRPNSRA